MTRERAFAEDSESVDERRRWDSETSRVEQGISKEPQLLMSESKVSEDRVERWMVESE